MCAEGECTSPSPGGEVPPLWRRCEQAVEAWLRSQGYAVNPLARMTGNSAGTEAPMLSHGAHRYRAPDFDSTKGGVREFWEVKYRSRPHVDPLTGRAEHRVDLACFTDYAAVQELFCARVWILVYEAATASTPARWLRISVEDAARAGRVAACPSADDQMVESQLWPVEAMEVVAIPLIDEAGGSPPIVSADEAVSGQKVDRYSPFERRLRERARALAGRSSIDSPPAAASVAPPERTLDCDRIAALDVLRRDLGIPILPRYSVLLAGGKGLDLEQVLGLLDYGIRLFLITDARDDEVWTGLRRFEQARLLEWECVPGLPSETVWIVDGNWHDGVPGWVSQAAEAADRMGGVNMQQFRIVHAKVDADVLVTAGAGTGKTETMTERLVFLLSTVHGHNDPPTETGRPVTPRALGLEDVGLVTFTREAAKEMRRRIARTVTLRQRLCPRCVHPTAAWLTQLGRTQISTIHMFARGLVRQFGSVIGMGPSFAVSSRTLELQSLIREALSEPLERLLESNDPAGIPPLHEWVRHIEAVWSTLENNGVPLVALTPGSSAARAIEWGSVPDATAPSQAVRITGEVVERVAAQVGDQCRREQFLRTSQLVPAALEAVQQTERSVFAKRRRRLRFLFVDEFQDTDSMQLDLLLAIRDRLDARLFVVGDAKQGIYRFRGASGNAFEALAERVRVRKSAPFAPFALTRNFRSEGRLLDSMHPYFATWGVEELLPYSPKERLVPRASCIGRGSALESRRCGSRDQCLEQAARLAVDWRAQDPAASIAILCRRNSQAMQVQRLIADMGGQCTLLFGGTFFVCEAVREMRVLLEAVLNPTSTAALLELCETRWSAAILAGGALWGVGVEEEAWAGAIEPPMGWLQRFATLGRTGSFEQGDLDRLRRRVEFLAQRLRETAAIAFLVECHTRLDPAACGRGADEDGAVRISYSRNLDHLLTLIDAQFQNSGATADAVLEWLRVQIATNRTEEEPAERRKTEGETTALTVHKAKGLEFDRVIVPCTDTPFENSASVRTEAFVTEEDGRSRLWWRWRAPERDSPWKNGGDSLRGWQIDEHETKREETRLLYVAMTRAKSHLVVFRPIAPVKRACWHHLLALGETFD